MVGCLVRSRTGKLRHPVSRGQLAGGQVHRLLSGKGIFQLLSASSKLILRLCMVWKALSILSLNVAKSSSKLGHCYSRELNHFIGPDHFEI